MGPKRVSIDKCEEKCGHWEHQSSEQERNLHSRRSNPSRRSRLGSICLRGGTCGLYCRLIHMPLPNIRFFGWDLHGRHRSLGDFTEPESLTLFVWIWKSRHHLDINGSCCSSTRSVPVQLLFNSRTFPVRFRFRSAFVRVDFKPEPELKGNWNWTGTEPKLKRN